MHRLRFLGEKSFVVIEPYAHAHVFMNNLPFKGCVCVRNGDVCTNCTPSRSGKCENFQLMPTTDQLNMITNTTNRNTPPQTQEVPLSLSTTLGLGRGERNSHELDLNRSGRSATMALSQQMNTTTPQEREEENSDENTQLDFTWGDVSSTVFCQQVTAAYCEVMHWRRNIFLVPTGKAGTAFIKELTKLYQAFADVSTLALKACIVLQCLLLQKPHARSKSKEHLAHLERRMKLWLKGDITALLQEGKCIQRHLPPPTNQLENLEKKAPNIQ